MGSLFSRKKSSLHLFIGWEVREHKGIENVVGAKTMRIDFQFG